MSRDSDLPWIKWRQFVGSLVTKLHGAAGSVLKPRLERMRPAPGRPRLRCDHHRVFGTTAGGRLQPAKTNAELVTRPLQDPSLYVDCARLENGEVRRSLNGVWIGIVDFKATGIALDDLTAGTWFDPVSLKKPECSAGDLVAADRRVARAPEVLIAQRSIASVVKDLAAWIQ